MQKKYDEYISHDTKFICISNAKILHSFNCMKCKVLLKLIFILFKQGRELKIHAAQEILWKIREGFI